MEYATWVRVVTYDWVLGIPRWAERDARDDPDERHHDELTVPPNTILWLERDVAHILLQRRAVYEPGNRQPYTPVLERKEADESPIRVEGPRRRRPAAGRHDVAVRKIAITV